MSWQRPPDPPCPTCGQPMTEVWGPRKAGPFFCEVCDHNCRICEELLPDDPAAAAAHEAACEAAWQAEVVRLHGDDPPD